MGTSEFEKSAFSRHFNNLTLLGAWALLKATPTEIFFYNLYKTFMVFCMYGGIYSLMLDLHSVFGDFKKMTWNLCVTVLMAGCFLKNVFVYAHRGIIDNLRLRLHLDEMSRKDPKDLEVHNSFRKQYRNLEFFYYIFTGLSAIFWLIVKYFSSFTGSRELPLPLKMPVELDLNNDTIFNLMFLFYSFVGFVGINYAMSMELAVLSILVQITREYKVFLVNIPMLSELYDDSGTLDSEDKKEKSSTNKSWEVNPVLRKIKTKMLIKQFSRRQERLIKYTKKFEHIYSLIHLLQFFATTFLVVIGSIQCILVSGDLSGNLSYQMGYTLIFLIDMFLVCWYSTRINTYCLEIGSVFYSTLWYKMNLDIQKDIYMIIMRSQRPPKITSGKIIVLNLHAFMLYMRNIYSCLTLYQQLASQD